MSIESYNARLTEAISRTKQLINEPGQGLYVKVLKSDIQTILSHLSSHTTLRGLSLELAQIWNAIYSLQELDSIYIQLLDAENATVPSKGSEKAIGWDLYASRSYGPSASLLPHARFAFSTGIAIVIPENCYGRIAPRSGLALKQGVDVLAGVIDCDYRGEIKVVLLNTTDNIISVDLSKPIAQLILERAVLMSKCMVVEELENTNRGGRGFGSSDVKESV